MKRQIRSDTLKKLAMLFMLLDHIGAIVLENIYIVTLDADRARLLYEINQVLRAIGRMAMPIFCYQVVVGLNHTRNKLKHLLTLLIAAIISEIPFNYAVSGKMLDMSHQNVIFTLLLGTVAVTLIDWFEGSGLYNDINLVAGKKAAYAAFTTLSVFLASATAELVKSDYGAKGVILIWIFYFFRNDIIKMSTYGILLFMIEVAAITYLRTHNINVTTDYCIFEAYACLAFPLIAMDNGQRKGGRVLKWFGYVFYPTHQAILYLIAMAIVKNI